MPLRHDHGEGDRLDPPRHPEPEREPEPPLLPAAGPLRERGQPRSAGPWLASPTRAQRRAELEAREDAENLATARWAWYLALIPLGFTQLMAMLMASVAVARHHADGRPLAGRATARQARRVAALLLVGLLGAGAWWVGYEGPRRAAILARDNMATSRANLAAIAVACRRFRDGPGRGERYADSWEELLSHGLIERERLRSPVDEDDGLSSYSYLGRWPMLVPPEQFILAFETFNNHVAPPGEVLEDGHLAVYADGRVEWIPKHQLQQLLHEQKHGPASR